MINILEINNTDLKGKRFNGYDLINVLNNTNYNAKQMVLEKESDDENVIEILKNARIRLVNKYLNNLQNSMLVRHTLSSFNEFIGESPEFKKADVVHYHLVYNLNINMKYFYDLTLKKPTILTIHDPSALTGYCVYPGKCLTWQVGCRNCPMGNEKFLEQHQSKISQIWDIKKWFYGKMDIEIIVASQWMFDQIKKSPLGDNFEQISVIPFGVDLTFFSEMMSKEEAKSILGIPFHKKVIFFRNGSSYKGVEYIKKALKMLACDKLDIVLLTCDKTGGLEGLADSYEVIELGWTDQILLRKALLACDIFLMPSTNEAFGVMAVEAMACSRPVVVFSQTALPEVTFAPDCGIAVEWGNTEALKHAVENLLEDPRECKRRGYLGRKIAEKHYSLELYHKRIVDLYNRVARAKK